MTTFASTGGHIGPLSLLSGSKQGSLRVEGACLFQMLLMLCVGLVTRLALEGRAPLSKQAFPQATVSTHNSATDIARQRPLCQFQVERLLRQLPHVQLAPSKVIGVHDSRLAALPSRRAICFLDFSAANNEANAETWVRARTLLEP
jgi:hypothetical protein